MSTQTRDDPSDRSGGPADGTVVRAPGPRSAAQRAVTAAALAAVALLGVLAVLALAPPEARDADAPATAFSAARAEKHLEQIAQRPHPTGTADNARVREYLVETARDLGAEVRVQSGNVVNTQWGSPYPGGTVHNVIAEVPGSAPETSGGKAVLLVSHYDSVPTGPGAADDGAAVAAMLETMRALKESGGVRNDVVFLFTDGEELGLLGARLFVREEGVEDYGAVLNWEARGSRGPVMMFETNTGNRHLIDVFADASSRPVANSLAYEVYSRMPNGSDFTVFRDAGAVGLNAAFLHGFHDYHSPHDDLEHLSLDSVQHHGESMLGLVRGLGDRDLRTLPSEEDAVYFDLFARVLVHYPADWALPLALATVLWLLALTRQGARSAALRVRGVLQTAGAGLAAVLLAALGTFGLWRAAVALRPELTAMHLSEPYGRGFFAAGFLVLTGAVLLGAARALRGRRPAELVAGGLTVGAVLLVAVAAVLPGVSYLFQWPLLAGLPALWWTGRRHGTVAARRAWAGPLFAAAAPAVAVVLYAPLVDVLLVALGIPLAAVAMLVACLGGLLLLPLLARVPRPGMTGVAAAVVALALVGTGLARSGFGPAQPRPDALVYVRDLAKGTTMWLGAGPEPDAWTRKALGDDPARTPGTDYYPQWDDARFMRAEAPALDLPAPTVRLTEESAMGDTRRLSFVVTSRRDAWQLLIRLPREPLKSCVVAGVRMDESALDTRGADGGKVAFRFTGARDGVEITCVTEAGSPLPVDVADFSLGLPPEAAALVGPRPEGTVAMPFGSAPYDSAVVRRTTEL